LPLRSTIQCFVQLDSNALVINLGVLFLLKLSFLSLYLSQGKVVMFMIYNFNGSELYAKYICLLEKIIKSSVIC